MNALNSVAILNPLGDFGINAYSFELAEGLCGGGVSVDVYVNGASPLSELPAARRHRCFPVLGSVLLKQDLKTGYQADSLSLPLLRSTSSVTAEPGSRPTTMFRERARQKFLEIELAAQLRRKRYDLVWTQWPEIYGHGFWATCRRLGMKTVHTVHNVLPHEENSEDVTLLRNVYGNSDRLMVHSEQSRQELVRLFPDMASRASIMRHGLYTIYPRSTEARKRLRGELQIGPAEVACLICGAIRPYKNIDSCLRALTELPKDVLLIVAGKESGFADSSKEDALAHTRRVAREFGVEDRVRLIPRFLGRLEMAGLFEAADLLLLPYIKGYGSGLLLLGMTFRKYIVTTDTGGASEYLRNYPYSSLLARGESAEVAAGIREGIRTLQAGTLTAEATALEELQWTTIARNALQII
ncbi:MAG TPA: glycosyltransferase [Terriglobales bacterium]|nr:glycosyltransferase [Terriglobales bacterium]